MPGLLERFLRAALGPLMPAVDGMPPHDPDPMETQAGVHLFRTLEGEHALFSETVDEAAALAAIRSIDWTGEFCQVFAVVRAGVWLEVGGSLDPQHGLSAVYVDRGRQIEAVIRTPPASVAEMEALMRTFLVSEDALLADYDFAR